ncbi:MAG TPA: hypothetical protein VNW04_02800 [Puia sp.]|nr:hypothetical protein [Puia sp.]
MLKNYFKVAFRSLTRNKVFSIINIFGDENPVGRLITLGLSFGNFDYMVGGVFLDKDRKSHIPAHFLLSMNNNDFGKWVPTETNWASSSIFYTYIRLKATPDLAASPSAPSPVDHPIPASPISTSQEHPRRIPIAPSSMRRP